MPARQKNNGENHLRSPRKNVTAAIYDIMPKCIQQSPGEPSSLGLFYFKAIELQHNPYELACYATVTFFCTPAAT